VKREELNLKSDWPSGTSRCSLEMHCQRVTRV